MKSLSLFFLLLISLQIASGFANTMPDPILDYWFGTFDEPLTFNREKQRMWFIKNPDTDFHIRKEFEETLHKAEKGELDQWKKTAKGRLALILLFDQFSRNIYRGTPQSFAYDEPALQLVLEGVGIGADLELNVVERAFFYMPFEHSEDLEMQKLSVASYKQLLEDAPEYLKENFESYLDYALQHQKIIERFGRYPHRNAILGRESTEQETNFLKEPGSSF